MKHKGGLSQKLRGRMRAKDFIMETATVRLLSFPGLNLRGAFSIWIRGVSVLIIRV